MESELSRKHLIIIAPPEIQRVLAAQLAQSSITCEVCDNVYMATALVFRNIKCKNRNSDGLLLALWLDNLSPLQMGFIDLVVKHHAGTLFALSDDESRLELALERGVHHAMPTGVFTSAFLAVLSGHTKANECPTVAQESAVKVVAPTMEPAGQEASGQVACKEKRGNAASQMAQDISLSREEIDSLLSDDVE